ncbi:23S rRNA pseudouridine1911/1915/1917 synthase [Clostridium acidisoli DSM 12555]|uniref:Pseudouridine synthase n=1 Tax=Clostridium acidisoli DSM 12555 TaxID=1121291 RepID=A0A1W1X1Q0_9CLOT|nr:RluA family pseudouridine synthase [Clostridium acidisoli]SMC17658.1 23S rRNA pseudouridine1911/1915/1917 synthase [Clostridium acidisoli DSM 12555]
MNFFEFKVEENEEGTRLDVYISSKLEDKSRSYIQDVIEAGNVKVNDKQKKSNYKLKIKDYVTLIMPENKELEVEKENITLDILYEDSDVIVVNKPQGMVVHPAPGNLSGTLVNALLFHCKDLSGINGVNRPGIVHRIDKDTSGILVVAKNDNAHQKLAEQLKEHTMTREYIALVEGVINSDEGTVDAPLGRHPVDRIKMSVIKNGRNAITHFEVLERFKANTLVKCILETGRTHQIRVHMTHIGHPIVGDPVYGYKKQKFKLEGQLLHAKKLGFIHPSSDKYMEFESQMPNYFTKVINVLRNELKK